MKYISNLSVKNIGRSWKTTTAGATVGSAWFGYHIIQSIHLKPEEVYTTSFIIIAALKFIVGAGIIVIGVLVPDNDVKKKIVIDDKSDVETKP